MYPHRAVPPHMDTIAPHVPQQLWGGQGAGAGAAAERGVAPRWDWAHSGLGEIERNKQIRGQIPLGGMGGGSKGLLHGSGGKDFGEQLKSGVEGGRKNAFLLR